MKIELETCDMCKCDSFYPIFEWMLEFGTTLWHFILPLWHFIKMKKTWFGISIRSLGVKYVHDFFSNFYQILNVYVIFIAFVVYRF